jgi:hypothetical protein
VDAGEERVAFFDGPEQIAPDFILDGAGCAAGIKIRNAL